MRCRPVFGWDDYRFELDGVEYGVEYELGLLPDGKEEEIYFKFFKDHSDNWALNQYILKNNDLEIIEEMETDTHTIRILTYNVWNFNKPYKKRMEKLKKQIEEIDPDIIGFQEVRYSNYEYPG